MPARAQLIHVAESEQNDVDKAIELLRLSFEIANQRTAK